MVWKTYSTFARNSHHLRWVNIYRFNGKIWIELVIVFNQAWLNVFNKLAAAHKKISSYNRIPFASFYSDLLSSLGIGFLSPFHPLECFLQVYYLLLHLRLVWFKQQINIFAWWTWQFWISHALRLNIFVALCINIVCFENIVSTNRISHGLMFAWKIRDIVLILNCCTNSLLCVFYRPAIKLYYDAAAFSLTQ